MTEGDYKWWKRVIGRNAPRRILSISIHLHGMRQRVPFRVMTS